MSRDIKSLHEDVVRVISKSNPFGIVSIPLESPHTGLLDLSIENPRVANAECRDINDVTALVDEVIRAAGSEYGIGGYNEKREWYARGEQFVESDETRSIHLGVDIWAPAGTDVYAPYDAVIHSVKDNAIFGDYGPTIILEHTLDSTRFCTLYGHLSRESLLNKESGEEIRRGQKLGAFGAPPINGDWPPHVHFQIITDMQGKIGDYPGVAAESDREKFLLLCPDPNLILRSPLLA
jgi:murein DD-endopeptidase MepM/ murein hydrolase activator NlpD